jgi:hypothetical protein
MEPINYRVTWTQNYVMWTAIEPTEQDYVVTDLTEAQAVLARIMAL